MKFINRKRNLRSWFWKWERKRNFKSWFWKWMGFLMPPHPLTNFEIRIIRMNQDLMVFFQEIIYLRHMKWNILFRYFGVEHISQEIKKFIGNKNIKANIFRIQEKKSIMCGYFCIGFIDFMLAGKKLTDYTSLFSPHDFKKNNHIILSYFKNEWK